VIGDDETATLRNDKGSQYGSGYNHRERGDSRHFDEGKGRAHTVTSLEEGRQLKSPLLNSHRDRQRKYTSNDQAASGRKNHLGVTREQ